LRADLLRLLGAMLYEIGDLDRAEAVLSEGSRIAAAVGPPALHAQIRALLAEIRPEIQDLPGGSIHEALAECEAAAATLEADGDLEDAAEAWLSIGKLRFFLGESPGDEQAFERAAAYARRSGSRQTELASSQWLALISNTLRIPADVAIDRVEQLLTAASGELWTEAGILMTLAHLYAYSGRFAEARTAIARSRSLFCWLRRGTQMGNKRDHRRQLDREDRRRPRCGGTLAEGRMRGPARVGRARLPFQRRL
jgi:tetratricopeptide (TPR) repeat protein